MDEWQFVERGEGGVHSHMLTVSGKGERKKSSKMTVWYEFKALYFYVTVYIVLKSL